MNTELRKNYKMLLKKDFFKLKNNVVFSKTKKNLRNNRDIKFVTTEAKRNYLVSEPNHHTTKGFSGNLSVIEMKKYSWMN